MCVYIDKYRSTVKIAGSKMCEEWNAMRKINAVLITKSMIDIQLHYHRFGTEVCHMQSECYNGEEVSVSQCLSTPANRLTFAATVAWRFVVLIRAAWRLREAAGNIA